MKTAIVVHAVVNVVLTAYCVLTVRFICAEQRRNANDMKTNLYFARANKDNAKANVRTAKALEAQWAEFLQETRGPQ